MAIIVSGYEINIKKQVFIALTSIYGVGQYTALQICREVELIEFEIVGFKIDPYKRAKALTTVQINAINNFLRKILIGDDLRKKVGSDKKALIETGAYRGKRLINNLPCNGQRTRSNCSTVKSLKAKI